MFSFAIAFVFAILPELPVGYRFIPSDEELVRFYLINKVYDTPIPAEIVKEIDASEFYSKHPKSLVPSSDEENKRYYFIKEDENLHSNSAIRMVGNEIGFWKSMGEPEPIYDEEGCVFAYKVPLTYFNRCHPSKPKKTHWKMEEYWLPITENLKGPKWVVAKVRRGNDYVSDFI